jgi:hypothetical protein
MDFIESVCGVGMSMGLAQERTQFAKFRNGGTKLFGSAIRHLTL